MAVQKAVDFIKEYDSFIITTHDHADPDGLGAEILLHSVLKKLGKNSRIINARHISELFSFMIPEKLQIETWDGNLHKGLPEQSALFIVDTSDEFNISIIADEVLPLVRDVMIIDHHELNPLSKLDGYIDLSAASTSEMVVEIAVELNIPIDAEEAKAALAGIVYDSGSFAYSKTSYRTFKAATILAQAGAAPYAIYQALNESFSTGAVLLQKKVLSSLEFYLDRQIALQVLRKEDLISTGAKIEDAENFINLPLKSREVKVSILIKEGLEGPVRCSFRSKGTVNVSKIAQTFNGGGHATAAGFKSRLGVDETIKAVLEKVTAVLSKA